MIKYSVLICIVVMATVVQAADYSWDGGGSDDQWSTDENWVGDSAPNGPTGTGKVYIQSGTVEMNSDVDIAMTSHLYLGGAGSGLTGDATLTANGGTLFSTGGYAILGYNETDTGTLDVNSTATMSFNGSLGLGIGWYGKGIVDINGGTVNASRLYTSFKIESPGGSSLTIRNGGALNVTESGRVANFDGQPASGTLADNVIIEDGTLTVGDFLIVGVHNTTNLTLSGTGQINIGTYFQLSAAAYSEGIMTMNDGTVTCGELIIGGDGGGYGSLDLLGGTVRADTLSMNSASVLNIEGGALVLDGEITSITAYGNVLANSGTGIFNYAYDSGANATTITAQEIDSTIVFVDANVTNTTVNGAALQDGVNYADGSNSISDDLWGIRDRSSVNGGYIWTTDAPASSIYAETTEPLVTTMTIDGPAGEYRVFGLFYISQQGTSLWDCAFSLDGETYINYGNSNASQAQTMFFTDPVLVADVDGTGYLFIVQIGTVTTAAANEQVPVYVQGMDISSSEDNRSWFEGIGYQDAAEAALIPEPVILPEEPNIQPGAVGDITINKKDTGYRGVWYYISYSGDAGEYVYKYSGGLGTYCTRHRPLAIYRPEVDKTFFTYGGTSATSNEQLWHMVSCYDHQTQQVSMPTLLLDKKTNDAHDNPVMSMDADGYVWIFSTSHGTGRPSYIHKSKLPYDIDEFELIESTKIDASSNVVPFTNFSYFQPWSDGADGFSAFLTIYNDPVTRTIQFMKTTDGVNWSQPKKISIAGQGAYQISGQSGSKMVTAFNFHPNGQDGKTGVDWRTNLYVVQTLDNGQTWQTVDGTPVTLPLDTPDILTTPMLVKNTMSPWRNVYLNDIVFDDAGNPVITYITTDSALPGPDGGPRYWEIARWDGSQWVFSIIGEVDHGFDGGTLYIESDGTWRVIGAFVGGPQPYGTGGELEMYTSSDQGVTWTKVMDVTSGSEYNHTHIRRPLNAKNDFYGFWADGHSREPSESNIYYCDKAGNVTKLPRGTGPAVDDCDLLVPEDTNHDCEVNLKDLAEVAENWQAEGNNSSTISSGGIYVGPEVDDSFEVETIGELPYTLSSTAPVISTDYAFSGTKSLFYQVGDCGTYSLEPFSGQSLSNATASVQIYLPETNAAGRAYISIEDAVSNQVMLIIDSDAGGVYDVLYRIGTAYTRPIEDIGSGWHQLGFVVYANNAVGIYLDDQYLTTATNFTTGLNTVKFGKPWGDFPDIAVYYDDLKVTYDTDVIGGGSLVAGDIYEDFEYYSAEGFGSIGGYAYLGNPTFSNVIQRSANQVICTANTNSTKMTKTLAATVNNCRTSAWIYVPYVNSGQGYLRATSPNGGYAFVGVNPNPDRVYYRFETDVYSGFEIDKGWHLMSIVVDYQGYFHLLFDNNYLGTYTESAGVSEISFGNPWTTAGYVAYDSFSLNQDVRGGFFGDWNTAYRPGDFSQNGVVDIDDIVLLTSKWLTVPTD